MTRIEKIFELKGAMTTVDGLRDDAAKDFSSPIFQTLDIAMHQLEGAMEALEDTED